MKIQMSLLVTLPIVLAVSCEKISYPKSSIGVVNNSTHEIAFYFAVGGEDGILYPDTTLSAELSPPFPIARADAIGYRDFGFSEEELFEGIPSDTLSVYIFHPDTLSKYDWDTVIDNYKILKRYDLSFGDLKRLDWQVYYPPNDKMDGVKMYP